MQFVKQISESEKGNIFAIQGYDFTGSIKWYWLKVSKTKLPLFEKAIAKTEPTNLEDFGKIIKSGNGKMPEEL